MSLPCWRIRARSLWPSRLATAIRRPRLPRDFNVPRTFTSADDLIAQPDMDAVVISSAPHLHFPQAKAALERGLHVLVEKPMTFTAAEARQLVELAQEKGVHLVSCFPWHHTRHGQEARRVITQGELGDVRMISILMTNPVDHLIRGAATFSTHGRPYIEPLEGTYSDPAVAGGGQIYAQVAHVAGYLTFLTGARPAQVFARFHNDGSRLDIFDVLNVELENGCLASIASTGATPLENRLYEVRIYGTKACLFIELWAGTMTVMRRDGGGETRYPDLRPNEIFPNARRHRIWWTRFWVWRKRSHPEHSAWLRWRWWRRPANRRGQGRM